MRVRSGPGTNFPQVGSLPSGYKTYIYELKRDSNGYIWGRITTNTWICLKLNNVYYSDWKLI